MHDKQLEDSELPRQDFEKSTPPRPLDSEAFRRHMQPAWDLIARIERETRVPYWRRQKPFTV